MKFITILIRNISRDPSQRKQRREGADHKGEGENVTQTIAFMDKTEILLAMFLSDFRLMLAQSRRMYMFLLLPGQPGSL